jgi:succinate dehydrogenase / fumarate reductase cytochrome b subunit
MSEPIVATPHNKPRKEFRNIHVTQIMSYRLPLAGYVSIMHRISGLLMFLLLPAMLYLLELSITSEISFATFSEYLSFPIVKLVILAMTWGYLHHLCAGIRHLFMDTHCMVTKEGGFNSAIVVYAISVPITALVAFKLFVGA